MKFKVEKWEGDEPKTWVKLGEFLNAGEAVDIASSNNRAQDAGEVVHRVVEMETGKVVYVRGYIKNEAERD